MRITACDMECLMHVGSACIGQTFLSLMLVALKVDHMISGTWGIFDTPEASFLDLNIALSRTRRNSDQTQPPPARHVPAHKN
jgi:hypothetical protein